MGSGAQGAPITDDRNRGANSFCMRNLTVEPFALVPDAPANDLTITIGNESNADSKNRNSNAFFR